MKKVNQKKVNSSKEIQESMTSHDSYDVINFGFFNLKYIKKTKTLLATQ